MLIDSLLMSFQNLGRKKSRSTLTVLGIAIGCASVVLISSLGEIGKTAISQELGSLGGGLMISGNSKIPGARLTQDHLELIRTSGSVDSAVPVLVDYTKIGMRGLVMDTVVWGIDFGANQVISMELLHGRLITKSDVSAKKQVCVVDQNVAQAFYKRDNIVGKTVSVQLSSGNAELTVVGVVASGGNVTQSLMGQLIPSFLYLPYTTVQELSGRDNFDQIMVKTKPGVDGGVAGDRIISSVARMTGLRNAFKAENMQNQKNKVNRMLNNVTLLLSAIAAVSLVVAGLSIMTIMLVSVHERTREIGIKKSIGACRSNILLEFLIEAFAISLLGSLLGTAVAVALAAVGCFLIGIQFGVSLSLVGMCILFSVFVGVSFGVYPAAVASRLRPVDALRCD